MGQTYHGRATHPPLWLNRQGNWAHRVVEILNCELGEALGHEVFFALGRHSLEPGGRKKREVGMGSSTNGVGAQPTVWPLVELYLLVIRREGAPQTFMELSPTSFSA